MAIVGQAIKAGSLGAAIRRRRDALRLRQDDMEQRTGLDQGYLSRVERGVIKSPGVEIVARIAAALECSVSELLREAGIEGDSSQPAAEDEDAEDDDRLAA